ncbi:hypothetical protein DPMN_094483, partial [Dreissena polymorpha]
MNSDGDCCRHSGVQARVGANEVFFASNGFTNVFGAGVTMLGMLMIAVAVLAFLYALRLFLIAGKLRETEKNMQ